MRPRDRLRPRGADRGGGPRAAPRRHVAPDPRGVDGAQPARRCSRSCTSTGRRRIAFCTDDRDPEDIADDGHINGMVRKAVAAGIAPEDALVMASFHPALWHGLRDHGAIAPGYQADLLVLPDLEQLRAGRRAQARPPDRGRPAGRDPRLGPSERPHQAGHAGRLRDPRAGGTSARSD